MKCGKMKSALRLFSDEEKSIQVGKDLRVKELGAGLYQRKDGRYYARFRSICGKRPEKGFARLADARAWLAEQEYNDAQESSEDNGT